MKSICSLSDMDLVTRTLQLVRAERACAADVIEHLVEIDRRQLYLDQATSSLSAYCIERLGYSEDEAGKRVRIARLARQFPQVLEELRTGAIHMTGLVFLAPHLDQRNCSELVEQARNKSKSEIEKLIAAWFPKPDIPAGVHRELEQVTAPALSGSAHEGRTGSGTGVASSPAGRVKPLAAARWAVQFSAGNEFREKLERARELLSHSVPRGEIATVLERALDALIERETKRLMGVGKSRKQRPLKDGSRHVPRDVARAVRERDGHRCSFVDAEGRRCTARRFLTIEHRNPYACEGPATVENLCLLCAAHNLRSARKVLGDALIDAKIAARRRESDDRAIANDVIAKTHSALCTLGFSKSEVRSALRRLQNTEVASDVEAMLRAALALLVPDRRQIRCEKTSQVSVGNDRF